jgi:hypothetical protein
VQPRGVLLYCRLMSALSIRFNSVRPRQAWKAYERALERRPLATKVATSVVGFALGDVLCQVFNRPTSGTWHYDVARTARMAAFGGAVGGPIGHYWFNFLDKVLFFVKACYISHVPCWMLTLESFVGCSLSCPGPRQGDFLKHGRTRALACVFLFIFWLLVRRSAQYADVMHVPIAVLLQSPPKLYSTKQSTLPWGQLCSLQPLGRWNFILKKFLMTYRCIFVLSGGWVVVVVVVRGELSLRVPSSWLLASVLYDALFHRVFALRDISLSFCGSCSSAHNFA